MNRLRRRRPGENWDGEKIFDGKKWTEWELPEPSEHQQWGRDPSFGEGCWYQLQHPNKHGLPSEKMARITSDCGAMRYLSITWL